MFLVKTLALPKNTDGVFLNEDLTFFFSADLDRASVTSESVSIGAADGTVARGAWSVNGKSLSFKPAPVTASDLSDGGYRPDTEYTVLFRGFPWVDGLRGQAGEPLRETFRYTFKTVSARPQETLLFVDPEPDKTRPLGFFPPPASPDTLAYQLGVDDAVYLASTKPIDPTSVRDEDFLLRRIGSGAPVRVRARLIENEPEARTRPKPRRAQSIQLDSVWESQPRAALLELTPVVRFQDETKWSLERARDEHGVEAVGPRDFSGHALWGLALSRPIVVGSRGRDAGRGILREEFVDTILFGPLPVPEVDGTAHWGDTGRVEARFPAAAGDGALGHVELSGVLASNDVNAISLTVPRGARVELPATGGLVVLRAQGRLRIAGTLARAVLRRGPDAGAEPSLALDTRDEALKRSLPLTRWLERMRAEGRTVTVLVAGGDVVIEPDAELRANSPILIAAGGRVRVQGRVLALPTSTETRGSEPNRVYVLGEGGGGDIRPEREEASLLDLDPPCEGNPLREELHYAVLSGPIPQRGSVASWTSAEAVGSPRNESGPGRNRWSVRYVREIAQMPASLAELGAVDRPQTLEPAGSIQILIELWVAPGARFEPPFVDAVQLTWEQKLLGGPR